MLSLMPTTALIALVFLVPSGIAMSVLGRSQGIYPDMEPAMGMTIVAHLLGGILLSIGLLL
jgi:hypothetical protein